MAEERKKRGRKRRDSYVRVPKFINTVKKNVRSLGGSVSVPLDIIKTQIDFAHRIVLFVILLAAALLRLTLLGDIPPGITNDESGTIFSAYSIWKTGMDPTGAYLPVSTELDNSFSPISIYAAAPFVGLIGLSPITGRLASALAGVASIFMIYALTKLLTKSTTAGLAAAALLATSPWHMLISRSVGDPNFALLFFLITLYTFLLATRGNTWAIVLSVLTGFLAFHSYHATKIFFVFLMPMMILIYWKNLRMIARVITIVSFILTVASFYVIGSAGDGISRSSLLIGNNLNEAGQLVDWERQKSSTPDLIRQIYSNKATVLMRWVLERYLEAYSTQFLYLYGETGNLVSNFGAMINQGAFYFFTLPLLLLGFVKQLTRPGKAKYLVAVMLFIAPLPSALATDKSYVFRSYMMIIPLIILISSGVVYSLELLRNLPRWLVFFLAFMASVVIFWEISGFLVHYFYRYPVYGAERWFVSSKELAFYLRDNRQMYDKVYIPHAGKMFMLQYAIYTGVDPNEMINAWNAPEPLTLGNVSVIDTCPDPDTILESDETSVLLVLPDLCSRTMDEQPIHEIIDRGETLNKIWKMYRIE